MDYYSILNVTRSATDQEIKKAYRKLAMKWHPDKNKANLGEAQYRFQEISEAYDVLSDPQKRSIFDQYGFEGLRGGVPDENGDIRGSYAFNERSCEEVFSKFFGSQNPFHDFGFGETLPFGSSLRAKSGGQCPPIELDIHCSLEELFTGIIKFVDVERTRVAKFNELIQETTKFQVKVKAGAQNGLKITFEKEGNENRSQLVGDVVFRIVQQNHEQYEREGKDLIFTAKIKLVDALGDYCATVPTLDGRKLAISCNEVIDLATRKRVKGEGMPIISMNDSISNASSSQAPDRGDLIIKFDIIFPKYLTNLQKTALATILA